jgi:hypothetical protein
VKHDRAIRPVQNAMNCPRCDADIGGSYEDRSVGSCGGWYCDACELAIREHEVPREPMADDVEMMSAREFRGDRPLVTPLSELSTQPSPKDDRGHPDHARVRGILPDCAIMGPPLKATTSRAMCPNRISMEVLMPPDSVSADAEPSEVVPPAVTPHEPSETGFTWNTGVKRADPLTVAPRRPRLYLAPVLLTTAAPSPLPSSASP